MKSVRSPLGMLACLGLVFAAGCRTPPPDRGTPDRPSQVRPEPVRVDYAESEAFDLFLETALVSRQPVIIVQTAFNKPEWGSRLNAWIAAWNSSRQTPGLRSRGQLPPVPSVVVDGDSIREFRLLIDGLMGRVEESARAGGHWWAERHTRERRVTLLRPYSLRFHLGADGHIQLIFFHGDYAAQHKDVVRALADPVGDETLEWFPGYCCSLARERVSRRSGIE